MAGGIINYQREMDELQERSRRSSSFSLPYTESTPFPVKAGPGHITKGILKRLPGEKSYASGQTVANRVNTMVEFPGVTRFPKNGSGIIIGGKLTKSNTSVQNVGFRIWLYQISFPLDAASKDGNPLEIRWGRRDDRIGYMDFDTFSVGVDCAESQAYIGLGQSLLFSMNAGNSLYGLVQTLNPYVAMSEEELDFYLHISQD